MHRIKAFREDRDLRKDGSSDEKEDIITNPCCNIDIAV